MANDNGLIEMSSQSQNGRPSTTLNGGSNAPSSDLANEDGTKHWLCDPGPYQKYIESLYGSNPGLAHSDPNNKGFPLKHGNALVALLDAPATGKPNFSEAHKFRNSHELQVHLAGTPENHDRRRIYIMEGLAPDYVSVIGGHFFMEPTFFQRHERTCVWSNDFTPVSDALPRPSLLDPDTSFHLQYCELRQFNKPLKTKYSYCERTRRHVGMTPPRPKENSTTGIMRRKVGWWSRKTSKGWDAVILCDPQLDALNPQPDILQDDAEAPKSTKPDDLLNTPFQGGYADFLPAAAPEIAKDRTKDKPPHPHQSMLCDLLHYFEQHSDLIKDWESPSTSAIFLKKIVAAHYLQLIDYIKAMLPSLELRLTTAWIKEQDQWGSLQTISRRCGNYRDDIEDVLLSLRYPLDIPSKTYAKDWKDCELDFHYIYFRLKILKERADNLMQAMTGLASIAGNRQNLEEAKRVKRLNLLALLFIPLAYTSSIFSMQDNYAPNKSKFWVYWVCALGAVAVTIVITWIVDSALDDAAQWSWRSIYNKKHIPGKKIWRDRGLHRP